MIFGVYVGTIMDDDDDEALVLMGDADRIKLVQSKRVHGRTRRISPSLRMRWFPSPPSGVLTATEV